LNADNVNIPQHQSLVLAGCFDDNTPWLITNATIPQRVEQYNSNACEADQLLWRHAVMCTSSTILLYSPDTDVYNIGLAIPPSFVSLFSYHTSEQLYNSIKTTASTEDKHKEWILKIRSVISERITKEEERMPSITALWRHWLRTTYICKLNQNVVDGLSMKMGHMPLTGKIQ
jgi:hypothetical protein